MRAIDLLLLYVIPDDNFDAFESVYSCRKKLEKTKEADRIGVKEFIKMLSSEGYKGLKLYDGFYFSFSIDQIGKEFDLLKMSDDGKEILNIELKSQTVDISKMKEQLIKNKYYLNAVCKSTCLYSIDLEKKIVYLLNDEGELIVSSVSALVEDIRRINNPLMEGIEKYFSASKFLLSPISQPELFLSSFYCLNSKQEEIKKHILWEFDNRVADSNLIGVTGLPGTGKSLLLYDIAREIGKKSKVLVIHCAKMSSDHERLKIDNVDIKPVKNIRHSVDFDKYDLVLVDEAHRIYTSEYELITQETAKNKTICVMFYDEGQMLANTEISRNISQRIKKESSGSEYALSKNIRVNPELAAFVTWFFDLHKWNRDYKYENVDILYATDKEVANAIKEYYVAVKGYKFINFTSSYFKTTPFDAYSEGGDVCTHEVIGGEFEGVVCIIDRNFYYNSKGKLIANSHATNDYLYDKMLYQNLTRAREKICIIIMGNEKLFSKVIYMLKKKYETIES